MSKAKMVERVRALRALAGNNPSEEEAKAAQMLANRLMEEHGISEEDVTGPRMPEPGAAWTPPPMSEDITPQGAWGGEAAMKNALISAGLNLGAVLLKRNYGIDVVDAMHRTYSRLAKDAKTEEEKASLQVVWSKIQAYFGGALALVLLVVCTGCSSTIPWEDGGPDASPDASVDTDIDTDDAGVDTDTETDTGSDPVCPGWEDPSTGLCWAFPGNLEDLSWSEASTYCEGNWRLPTIDEARSLVQAAGIPPGAECLANVPGGACGVTDPDCLGVECLDGCGSCVAWEPHLYQDPELDAVPVMWTSSPVTSEPESHWALDMATGSLTWYTDSTGVAVRCLREVL